MSDNSTTPLSIELLRAAVDYNPETGALTWRPRLPMFWPEHGETSRFNRQMAGRKVGCVNGDGYRHFEVGGRHVKSHRAAWALFYGCWPEDQIDHINGDKLDNRIANLREVDSKQNSQNKARPLNNKSGVVGVHYCNTSKKWHAKIQGRVIGRFDDFAAAVAARKDAAVQAGFHPNHGRVNSKERYA